MNKMQFFSCALVCFGLLASCDSTKRLGSTRAMEDHFIGIWEYTISDTPEGDFKGNMVITKESDAYRVTISNDQRASELEDVLIEEKTLSGTYDYQGYQVDLKGVFEGELFKGNVGVDYMSFPMEAKKIN